MDKLERMFGHLGNLSSDELRARVRKVRADRRITKPWAGAAKRAKRSIETAKGTAKTKAKRLIGKDLELLQKIMKDMGLE